MQKIFLDKDLLRPQSNFQKRKKSVASQKKLKKVVKLCIEENKPNQVFVNLVEKFIIHFDLQDISEFLITAIICNRLPIASYIIDKHCNCINIVPPNEEYAPIHLAVKKSKSDFLVKLLEAGAKVNSSTKSDKRTPLHISATCGRSDYVSMLLEMGAKSDRCDIYGNRPLHLACMLGHEVTVKSLLNDKCLTDIDANNNDGWTSLHLAAAAGHVETMKLLLERGSQVDLQTKHGKTSLHWACSNNKLQAVKLLLEHSADVSVLDLNRKSAYDYSKDVVTKNLVYFDANQPKKKNTIKKTWSGLSTQRYGVLLSKKEICRDNVNNLEKMTELICLDNRSRRSTSSKCNKNNYICNGLIYNGDDLNKFPPDDNVSAGGRKYSYSKKQNTLPNKKYSLCIDKDASLRKTLNFSETDLNLLKIDESSNHVETNSLKSLLLLGLSKFSIFTLNKNKSKDNLVCSSIVKSEDKSEFNNFIQNNKEAGDLKSLEKSNLFSKLNDTSNNEEHLVNETPITNIFKNHENNRKNYFENGPNGKLSNNSITFQHINSYISFTTLENIFQNMKVEFKSFSSISNGAFYTILIPSLKVFDIINNGVIVQLKNFNIANMWITACQNLDFISQNIAMSFISKMTVKYNDLFDNNCKCSKCMDELLFILTLFLMERQLYCLEKDSLLVSDFFNFLQKCIPNENFIGNLRTNIECQLANII